MTQNELKNYAIEHAKKHEGFESGLTFTEERTKIDQDLAICFSDSKKVGPQFLLKENEEWKIIVD